VCTDSLDVTSRQPKVNQSYDHQKKKRNVGLFGANINRESGGSTTQ
jgi:hypothetical protein